MDGAVLSAKKSGVKNMDDIYQSFAFDYDEFGPIENYLGNEKPFLANCSAKTKSRLF